MRASDLLGSRVFDVKGAQIGHLFDITCRKTGPLVSESWGNALQVDELLVGSAGIVMRLGFRRREMRGPHGLRFLAARAKGFRVKWDQVASIEERKVRLNVAREALAHLD